MEVTVQGSVAHGTWLPGGEFDIDVFAAFPKTYGPEAIRSGRALSLLADIATAAGIPWSTRYAQHPPTSPCGTVGSGLTWFPASA